MEKSIVEYSISKRTSSCRSASNMSRKSLKPTNKAPEQFSVMPMSNLVNLSAPAKRSVPFFLILDSNYIESLVSLVLAKLVKTFLVITTLLSSNFSYIPSILDGLVIEKLKSP